MIGVRLGTWVIEKELGRGGMGTVYLAQTTPPDSEEPGRAAIKVLAAELALDPGFRQRFQREIDIVRQLEHPNLVRFLGSGEEANRFFFAMEYVEGPSFETLRQARGKLPWPEVLDMALQVALALKHAHDRGIIHRDLKPSNILRTDSSADGAHPFGVVKLTDFGIATLFASPHLTMPGGIVGTAEFLSPEQAAGKPTTRRSDLYSLGVLLYTLLAGRTPFEGDVLELLHKHRYDQFERLSRLVPGLPPDLEGIVCDLLEKSPEKRPADGGVLFRRLDAVRRKEELRATLRKEEAADGLGQAEALVPSEEGPATLMSRLMRAELEEQNRGGRVKQFLNQPSVLVTLFLLTVGLIVWSFWPESPKSLFQRGAVLMASDDPAEWDRGWEDYLEPMTRKYPDHPYAREVEAFRRKYDNHQAERKAALAARHAGPMAEAQWFYQKGVREEQEGNTEAARRTWESLIASFRLVPSEGPWVRLAEQALAKEGKADRRWEAVRESIRRAKQLRSEGRAAEADSALRGLRELYRGDVEAENLLKDGGSP